jgi:hypothetical protein
MRPPLQKYLLLVPLQLNDGMPVPETVILDFQEKLFALGGGFTIAGTVKGAYRMADGTKQIDDSLQIWIGLPDDLYPDLERLVGELGTVLGQETMYLEKTGGNIHFIPPM